ncbi:hypothetical protein EVAR_89655_1 [Eumeta japonica]|uniref:Uncharacterized protein n=1 Tax=Eumeta variegata TaxID=151549 RepID=A0A4C1YD38_EUMVA|nr:hypothetical protein EVAR_89655_1 [Eumeta japonica]
MTSSARRLLPRGVAAPTAAARISSLNALLCDALSRRVSASITSSAPNGCCCFLSLRMKYSTPGVRTHQAGPRGEPSHIYDVPGMSGAYYVDRFPFHFVVGYAFIDDIAVRARRVVRGLSAEFTQRHSLRSEALVEFSEAVRYERLICPRVRSDPSQDCL